MLYSRPMALPRPCITPQQLGTQLLPGLLWMWPALGEGCEPGSPSFLFLLPGMDSVALRMLGKRYSAFLTPVSDSGRPLGAWALQPSEGGTCVPGGPSSWVLFKSGFSRIPACSGMGSSTIKERITRPEVPGIPTPPGPRSSSFAPGWSR